MVEIYETDKKDCPYLKWEAKLSKATRAQVRTRLNRIRTGNFGDCKPLKSGVKELRIHCGSGYRIYFGGLGKKVILLLCGGDKGSQTRDIKKAVDYWTDYKKNPRMDRGNNMANTKNYKEHLLEALKDPDEAAAYINAAMEDGELEVFLLALHDVAEAQGGFGSLAKKTELNRESLYRTLSRRGNPRLRGLKSVLEAFGLCLSVIPINQKSVRR